MSQENVELARRGVEAFVAGDWETWCAGVAPEVEWEETPGLGPDAAIYRGIEDVRAAISSWTAMWTDYEFEVHDYLDADDDQVVVLAQERGHGRGTEATVERKLGEVFTFRNGKLIRARLYGSWAEALEAAGLSV
jgi:ketosteroid isomerase-like protein